MSAQGRTSRSCSWPPLRTGSNGRQHGERDWLRGRVLKHRGLRERMERKLLTQRGQRFYRLRSLLVEPMSGQVKD